MEIQQAKFKIEKSVLENSFEDEKIAHIIGQLSLIQEENIIAKVSGKPLHIYTDTDEIHFNDCKPQQFEVVSLGRIYLSRIPIKGHYHLPEEFLSEEGYPLLQCFNNIGIELIMGMRTILDFEIEL